MFNDLSISAEAGCLISQGSFIYCKDPVNFVVTLKDHKFSVVYKTEGTEGEA